MRGYVFVGIALLVAGTDDPAPPPSWLLVELAQAENAPERALNVRALLQPAGREPFGICVNVDGEPGVTTASLLLERAADADPAAPVTVEVSAYREIGGSLGPGLEFTCPPSLPPEIGTPQSLELRFCPGEARRVVFHLGGVCDCATRGGVGGGGGAGGGAAGAGGAMGGGGGVGGAVGGAGPGGMGGMGGSGGSPASCCTMGRVCGAGVSSTGAICGEGECCKGSIADPCIELDAVQ